MWRWRLVILLVLLVLAVLVPISVADNAGLVNFLAHGPRSAAALTTTTMPMQYQTVSTAALAGLDPARPRFEQLEALWARNDWWSDFDPTLGWEFQSNNGPTGIPQVREARLRTAPSAGAWQMMWSSEDPAWTAGGINWDRIIVFRSEVSWNIYSYYVTRSTLGKSHADLVGPLTDKGIGFETWLSEERAGIYGVAHNGTDFYRIRLCDCAASGITHVLMVISYPDGYVEWLIDDDWRGALVPPGIMSNVDPKLVGVGPRAAPGNDGVYGRTIMQDEVQAFQNGVVEYVVHNHKMFIDQRRWQ